MAKYKLQFKGRIIEGDNGEPIFNPDDSQRFTDHSKALIGEEVSVSMERYKDWKQRSNLENRYVHGVVCKILSDENGDTPIFWYKYLKVRFLLPKIVGRVPDMDKLINSGKFDKVANMLSFASLGTKEFEEVMTEIRSWTSSGNEIPICYVPAPNEVPFKY